MKRIEIFRPGKHISAAGETIEFTEADLQKMASVYDPAKHEAPLVIGHPEMDKPAYGWVGSLALEGGNLVVNESKQVDPRFAEIVDAGHYKKRSAAFYPPNHKRNPVPGSWYLRHVGFLGAMPPSIQGLKPVEFSDDDEGVVVFGEIEYSNFARILRGIREFFISKFGLEDADKAIPGYSLQYLEGEALRADLKGENETGLMSYAEGSAPAGGVANAAKAAPTSPVTKGGDPVSGSSNIDQTAEFAERKKSLDDQAADIAKREAALRESEAKARRAEAAEFAEALVKEGKVLPRERGAVAEILLALPADKPVEFAEEGDKKTTKTPREAFEAMLKGLPKRVHFGEAAKPSVVGDGGSAYAAPAGYTVDPDQAALFAEATAYAAQNKVDFVSAVKAVGGK